MEDHKQQNSSVLIHLPKDLYFQLRKYLTSLDYLTLMNSSKKYYADIKQETIVFKFIGNLANSFMNNQDGFQKKVLQKIKYPRTQLIMVLDSIPQDLFNFPCPFYKLRIRGKISNGFSYSNFQNIESLAIQGNGYVSDDHIYEQRALAGINELELSYYWKIDHLTIKNRVQNIRLWRCENISLAFGMLSQVQELSIYYCETLVDVQPFRSIPKIIFETCPNILDISPLARNKQVSIINCYGIQNFDCSMECKRIKIQSGSTSVNLANYPKATEAIFMDTPNALDCAKLPRYLRSLEITNIHRTIDPRLFESLQSLTLDCCNEIFDVSSLGNIPILTIAYCHSVISLAGLGKPKQVQVTIRAAPLYPLIVDFCPLSFVQKVELYGCDGFRNAMDLVNVSSLRLTKCGGFHHLHNGNGSSAFLRLKSLQIVRCSNFDSLIGLENVPVLEINSSVFQKPVDYTGLMGRNVKITLIPFPAQNILESFSWFKKYLIDNSRGKPVLLLKL